MVIVQRQLMSRVYPICSPSLRQSCLSLIFSLRRCHTSTSGAFLRVTLYGLVRQDIVRAMTMIGAEFGFGDICLNGFPASGALLDGLGETAHFAAGFWVRVWICLLVVLDERYSEKDGWRWIRRASIPKIYIHLLYSATKKTCEPPSDCLAVEAQRKNKNWRTKHHIKLNRHKGSRSPLFKQVTIRQWAPKCWLSHLHVEQTQLRDMHKDT